MVEAAVALRTVCQPVGLSRRNCTDCPSTGVNVATMVRNVALVGQAFSTTVGRTVVGAGTVTGPGPDDEPGAGVGVGVGVAPGAGAGDATPTTSDHE